MYYNKFQDLELSALGLGCMRLPVIDGDDSKIDEVRVQEMIDYAMANGINYFDTAWGYHGGQSEVVVGEALSKYNREDFYLADKFPGYDLDTFNHIEEIFEKQLEKCKVDYFDFYLMHNVCEMNIDKYLDDEIGLFDYLMKQKELGRIKHLGFSTHGTPETIMKFLRKYGKDMEFCQIQLNYLDFEFQSANLKVEILNSAGIPIWVMEGLRGGKLAKSCLGGERMLSKSRPEYTPVNWAFAFLESIPDVTVTLSGMSDIEQLKENIEFYDEKKTLEDEEIGMLLTAAHFSTTGKDTVPCTGCRYCTQYCPKGLEIPRILELYNEHAYSDGGFIAPMALAAFDEDKLPSACIGCGACRKVCPQQIDIPGTMKKFTELLK